MARDFSIGGFERIKTAVTRRSIDGSAGLARHGKGYIPCRHGGGGTCAETARGMVEIRWVSVGRRIAEGHFRGGRFAEKNGALRGELFEGTRSKSRHKMAITLGAARRGNATRKIVSL